MKLKTVLYNRLGHFGGITDAVVFLKLAWYEQFYISQAVWTIFSFWSELLEIEESSRSSHELAWDTSKFSRLKVRGNLMPVDNSCGHSRGSYTYFLFFPLF